MRRLYCRSYGGDFGDFFEIGHIDGAVSVIGLIWLYWGGQIKVRKLIWSYLSCSSPNLVVCTVANVVLTVISKIMIIFRETVSDGRMYDS